MKRTKEQKEAIARAYSKCEPSDWGVKSDPGFRLNLSKQKRESLQRQKEELEKQLSSTKNQGEV